MFLLEYTRFSNEGRLVVKLFDKRTLRVLVLSLTLCCAFSLPLRADEPARADERYAPGYPENEPPFEICPRKAVALQTTAIFDFSDPQTTIDGWFASPGTTLARGSRTLNATSTELDPHFLTPTLQGVPAGLTLVKLRLRRSTWDDGRLYYAEKGREIDEVHSIAFPMTKERGADGGPIPEETPFRDYVVPIESEKPIERLRFDLGNSEGMIELERVELVSVVFEPLRFGPATLAGGVLSVALRNAGADPLTVDVEALGFAEGESVPPTTLEPGRSETFTLRYPQQRAFETLELVATARETGSVVRRRFFAFNESAPASDDDRAVWLKNGALSVRCANDGTGAELFRENRRVGVLWPLLCEEGDGAELIEPRIVDESSAQEAIARASSSTRLALEFANDQPDALGVRYRVVARPLDAPESEGEVVGSLDLRLDDDLLSFIVDCDRPVHAPVVRALGKMKQAVLPGVEFLEEGEHSSSSADLTSDARIRFAPPVLWITQPYAAIVTDRGSFTTHYDNPKARAIFAVPDFLDGDDATARFNVCASRASGTIRIVEPEPLEDAILWVLKRRGLPELPTPPRRGRELEEFILAAFEKSAITTPQGWIYTVFRPEPPQMFAPAYGSDFISTIMGISGVLPKTPRVDPGGSFIHDWRSLFMSQDVEKLRSLLVNRRQATLNEMKEDGSFRYYGRFLRGNQTDYASGYCATKAWELMENWRFTGDSETLDAALKALAFINALKTPRGAQTWEIPLHTPDVCAAAKCVMTNVAAYEATGNEAYLNAARRWAIDGTPFVYLWQAPDLPQYRDYPEAEPAKAEPVMKYATVAVYGATEGNLTLWLGRPVQWCGLDYAYALVMLSRYDKSFDWRRLADGIVSCAELQLHDGPVDASFNGLLPDSVDLATQRKYGGFFNPSSVWILRNMLEGRPYDASVVDVAGRRIVAPFPMRVNEQKDGVIIGAKKGTVYYVMLDGTEFRRIESVGDDEILFRESKTGEKLENDVAL